MRDLRHEQTTAWPQLAEWRRFLEVDEGKAPKTIYAYTRVIAQLLRMYPDVPFDGFTAEHVREVLALTPSRSRHITRSILNRWFEWGMNQDRLDNTPMRRVGRMKQPKRQPRDIYDEAEIAALEALPAPDGTLCRIMFTAGLRKAGCRNLRRRDIDTGRGRMIVTEKGNKTRVIPIPDETVAAVLELDAFEQLRPDDYLWYLRPGGRTVIDRTRPVSDTTFDRWWSGDPKRGRVGVCQLAGVRRLNVHQTRHTYADRLKRKGVSLEIRRVLLGHERIATTEDQYGRTDVEDAAAVIAEVWG